MADAIVRLRVESSEYDQKLGRATQQLQYMEKEVRRTGATFAYADKEELAFVQSLGSMETKSTSARQKLREYTEAITSMTATYRKMTEEERQSPFGKAMSASIDQLKAKASELQDIMSDTQREIQNLASDTSFTDGIGLMTRTVGSCAAAITAWTGDSKEMEAVIKDLAKIGATVAAVDSLTKAFQKQNLVLLKNPYVAAAAGVVALAVAMGKLIQKSQELEGVQKTLQEVQNKGRENAAKEITRIESLNNILHDNTRSMEERKSALAEIQALVPNYHGALTTEGTLINDNSDAIKGYVAELQRAATAQAAFDKMVELQKKKMQQQLDLNEKQKQQAAAQARNKSAQGQVVYAGSEFTQVYTQQGENAANRAVQQAEADIRATNAEIEALQSLVDANALSSKVTKITGKGATTNTSTGSGYKLNSPYGMPESGSLADLERQAAMVQASMKNAISPEEYKEMENYLNSIIAKMKELKGETDIAFAPGSLNDLNQQLRDAQDNLNNLTPGTEEWANALADVQAKQQAVNDLQSQMAVKVKETADSFGMFKDGIGAISALGNALDNLKNIGEDLASAFSGEMDAWDALMTVFNSGIGIMDTVVSVMEAINMLQELSVELSKKKEAEQAIETTTVVAGKQAESQANITEAGTSMISAGADTSEAAAKAGKSVAWIPIVGPILAVAAIAAVLGATLAAMSKAKSASHFATGGIVPGNDYSDNTPVFVSSGELILNRAQQNTLAGQLQGGNQGGVITGTVTGANIYLALANFAKQNNKLAGSTTGGLVLKIE